MGDKSDLEAEIWGAIAAFEQILEALPTDRASLEALWNAHEQIGDYTKAKDYLLRLANVVVDEGDTAAAAELLPKVKALAADDPVATEVAERIEILSSAGAGAMEELASDARATAGAVLQAGGGKGVSLGQVKVTFSMADELAFAWNLLEASQLTQEEYASVVQDLTEMSAVDSKTTVSVLHVLEARAFKNLERVMGYVAKECGAPIVSLASFDFRADEVALLPPEFMAGRGVFVFELLGKDALVVVMNPYDKQLRKDIESVLGRRCHYYMSLPSEFDKALTKLNEQVAGKSDQSKK